MLFRLAPSFLRRSPGLSSNGPRYINPLLSKRLFHQTKALQQWDALQSSRFSRRISSAIFRCCNKASTLIWGGRIERGIKINYRGLSYDTSTKVHTDHKHSVAIRHPGFPDKDTEPLIIMTALDKTLENGWGVQHAIAHACCAILTAKHQGYLSHDIAGGERVDLVEDAILPSGTYFFQIPNKKLYPIYSAYETWSIPDDASGELLGHYLSLSGFETQDKYSRGMKTADASISDQKQVGEEPMSEEGEPFKIAVRNRDNHRCVISGSDIGTNVAHIIPRVSHPEYLRDKLYLYNHNWRKAGTFQGDVTTATLEQKHQLTDDRNNCLLLRHDIHDAFDGGNQSPAFIFFPKWRQPSVIHFMVGNSSLSTEYHNTRAHICHSVPTELLFRRVVFTVFKHVEHGRKLRKRSCVKEFPLPRVESNPNLKNLTPKGL